MIVHDYEVNLSRKFVCTRGNSIYEFESYSDATKFITCHRGYTLSYHVIPKEKIEEVAGGE